MVAVVAAAEVISVVVAAEVISVVVAAEVISAVVAAISEVEAALVVTALVVMVWEAIVLPGAASRIRWVRGLRRLRVRRLRRLQLGGYGDGCYVLTPFGYQWVC